MLPWNPLEIPEMMDQVASYLKKADLARAVRVSKGWRDVQADFPRAVSTPAGGTIWKHCIFWIELFSQFTSRRTNERVWMARKGGDRLSIILEGELGIGWDDRVMQELTTGYLKHGSSQGSKNAGTKSTLP
ncbi:MAG: hypothetical protein J3Q66DRAFT_386684 [Benniella sp.]|nr:MAG: hypothetical protein J3Q66DRAFT_386684 [Benniella sp.]